MNVRNFRKNLEQTFNFSPVIYHITCSNKNVVPQIKKYSFCEKKTVWEYHEKQNKTKSDALFLFNNFYIHIKYLISIFHIQKYQPKIYL